jgi:hypothetical protein
MSLQKSVRVASRFQRSVRIDTDVGNQAALDGFRCTWSFARALKTLAENLSQNSQGAYTWTGPYGGGKSALALALCHVVGPRGKIRKAAEDALGPKMATQLLEAFRPGVKGWRVLPIVGSRAPAHALVWEALKTARLIHPKDDRRTPTASDVIQMVSRVAQRDSHAGLLIAIDELGRVLENVAATSGDLHFLQDLAEMASRSERRLVVLGVLHQAFEEYASRVGANAREEWSKVQGRFLDIPILPSASEQLELLARAIEAPRAPPEHRDLVSTVIEALLKHRPDLPADTGTNLARCWPLHPVTAGLLGPISRRRFGQNQRSLFAFLNSREPRGFQEFIRDGSANAVYSPAQLFDYLQLNFEPAILGSPDGHRWSLAIDALERATARGADEMHQSLLKSIALLDLFRERSGMLASTQLLKTLFTDKSKREFEAALERLKSWSVVAYREHLGAFAIFAGSDFDLQAALDTAKAAVKELDLKVLRQLANLRPIVAKRHYHETGAFRWLEVDVALSSNIQGRVLDFKSPSALGQVLILIPGPGDSESSSKGLAEELTKTASHPCVVGVCESGNRIRDLASELTELEQLRASNPQLRDDAVARREVDARSATVTHLLDIEIRAAFSAAQFYYRGSLVPIRGISEMSRFASVVADDVFSKTPRIVSELLNRGAPSPNAVAAKKALLKAMIASEDKPSLGFEGFPPERGLYDCILAATQLHSDRGHGAGFSDPGQSDPAGLAPLWKATDEFLLAAKDAPVSAASVFHFFASPPFGIKKGLREVLLVAYLLTRKDRFTIYVDNVIETPITDFAIDRLAINPDSLIVRAFDPNPKQQRLIEGMRGLLSDLAGENLASASLTTLARSMVSIIRNQPPWVLRTMSLTKPAQSIRSVLRAATDPQGLVYEMLPQALDSLLPGSSAASDDAVVLLRQTLSEIATAYRFMLQSLDRRLREELNVDDEGTLHDRASRLRGLTGELRLEAFVSRMESYRFGDEESIEGIASLAANKPCQDWSDNDYDAALVSIAELAQRFNRAEGYTRVKNRTGGRHAISIVVGFEHAPKIVSKEFDIYDKDRKQVTEIARLMSKVAGGARSDIVLAALAQIGSQLMEKADLSAESAA